MATNGDTLSWVLLVVAICALGSAALGAIALGARELSRRWQASARTPREYPTVQFRTPLASDLDAPDSFAAVSLEGSSEFADISAPSELELVDPTDRLGAQSLFEPQGSAADDPFEGDTVPVLDLEVIGRRDAVADL